MSDAFVRLPADGAGKRLDTEQLTVNALTVHRERNQLAGVDADDIAAVLDTDPSGGLHALLVRLAETISPQMVTTTVASVAAGSAANLDSTQITNGTTGKLLHAVAASSIPIKAELIGVSEALETLLDVRFSMIRDAIFRSPGKDFWAVVGTAGGGLDAFRMKITNLDTSKAADVYATFYWDEV